jgi:hypothetical protein
MDIEQIQKRDTVFINRDGGPKIGTVLSVNKKKRRILVAYRKSAFGYSTEHRADVGKSYETV